MSNHCDSNPKLRPHTFFKTFNEVRNTVPFFILKEETHESPQFSLGFPNKEIKKKKYIYIYIIFIIPTI